MINVTPSSRKPSGSSPEPRRPRRNNPRWAESPKTPRVDNGRFRRELSAGGIIYRKRGAETEFFFIKDPFGKWTFPKGHQRLGETLAETAIREIREETGLTGLRYIAPLGRTGFRFRRENTLIEKTVYLFLFEAPPDARETMLGVEGIRGAAWFQAARALSASGYRNLDRLLLKAYRMVIPPEQNSSEL